MSILECIKLALQALKANKLRSFLTMLGIIIGITAVITITTLGNSLSNVVSDEFDSFGTNIFDIYYYEKDESISDMDFYFTRDNINKFLEENPNFQEILYLSNNDTLKQDNGKDLNVSVLSGNDSFYKVQNPDIIYGRGLKSKDLVDGKHSCIVTEDFVKKMYKSNNDAIGRELNLKVYENFEQTFVIVGVYKPKSTLGVQENYSVMVPYEVTKKIVDDNSLSDEGTTAFEFYYENTTPEEVESVTLDYWEKIIDTEKYEVYSNDMNQYIEQMLQIINIITLVISIIAAIALVVGGVGVMNIMLVSVIERTKEIGIEKALGAKDIDIKRQFLIESVTICIIGCIIGILFGILNGYILNSVAGPLISNSLGIEITFSTVPSTQAMMYSCIFSTLIGVFFGLYPAKKAAKLNPIDALRYE